MRDREGAEDDLVDEGKDGGGRADAEREGEERGRGKGWRAAELA